MERRALDGVKVLELAFVGINPTTVSLLGANGATCVRVESTTRLDPLRRSGPYVDMISSPEHSAEFAFINQEKYGVSLNLKNPKAIEIAKKLAAWADIIVDGWTSGTLDGMGLGYEELYKINPGIIMLSCNTFGQTGPFASTPSTGIQLTGLTGYVEITGWPDSGAVACGYYSDFVVPNLNMVALLSALDYKRRTGKGQHIDISQLEAAIFDLAPLILDYTVNNRIGKRHGNRSPNAAPYGVFRCQGDDRWCAISVSTDEEWQSFCKVLESPAWTQDPKFTTLLGRKRNEDELENFIEEWTRNHSAQEVMNLMQADGVAAGVVQNEDEVFNDPQLEHTQPYRWLHHPGVGKKLPTLLPFIKLSKTPADVTMPAPMLGEHNEYVFTKILGMADEEFVELMVDGVFD